jgi:hypothetical protein
MITCQDARQLFDRYLDGELSPSLQAELHAHQLSCSVCQSELAILEACGDVVLLDRCEPKLSASFTDRVMLARRAQLARPPRRRLRTAVLVGSPVAAAASILLAVTLIMPSASNETKTVVLGEGAVVAVSDASKALLGGGQDRTEQAQQELENTPQMPVGFMEAWAASGVGQIQETLEGIRGTMDELELLLHQAAEVTNEKLAAQWQSTRPDSPAAENSADPGATDNWEWLSPSDLNAEPANDTTADRLLDPL